jgi:tetratricopeptide (TPR) repeat protein
MVAFAFFVLHNRKCYRITKYLWLEKKGGILLLSSQFSNRLKCILQTKGIKPAELSRLTNLSKMKISRTLNNERYPTKVELEEIAGALNISVKRLTGTDVIPQIKLIEGYLEEQKNLKEVISISKKLLDISICNSETIDYLNYMARAYYLLKDNKKAQELWEKVIELLDEDIDLKQQARVYHNLVLAYKAQGLTPLVLETYTKAEEAFDGSPDLLARFAHLKAGVLDYNPNEAKESYCKAIKLYELIGDTINRGRAHVGIARIYFKEQDYISTRKHLKLSIPLIADDHQKNNFWIAKRNLAKVLIILKKKGAALEIIEEALMHESEMEKGLRATFILMKSLILRKPEIAQRVVKDPIGVSEDILFDAHIIVNVLCLHELQNTSSSNDRKEIKNLLFSFSDLREFYTDEYILRSGSFT